jgi:hypothetical protein
MKKKRKKKRKKKNCKDKDSKFCIVLFSWRLESTDSCGTTKQRGRSHQPSSMSCSWHGAQAGQQAQEEDTTA